MSENVFFYVNLGGKRMVNIMIFEQFEGKSANDLYIQVGEMLLQRIIIKILLTCCSFS